MPRVTHKLGGAVNVVSMAEGLHNLMDNALLDDLTATYRAVHSAGCRAVLLGSSQRRSAPVPMWLGSVKQRAHFSELLEVLENIPLPTVAAVHGGALGRGRELALTCDAIICADPRSARGRDRIAAVSRARLMMSPNFG
jgi:enoyl-CoA hydratase/carnithine racemase